MAKTYGYSRASTNADRQDINRQNRELIAAGADEVFFEYEHGQAETKKELARLLSICEQGDTIITLEVSRLSRSTKQLCDIIEVVKQKGLRLIIVGSITVDCRSGSIDAMTKAFLQMAGVFAEVEVEMTRARVRSGLENAKAKGKVLGRRPTTKDDIPDVFYKHYPLYRSKQINKMEFSRLCDLSRPTVDKYIKIVEGVEA